MKKLISFLLLIFSITLKAQSFYEDKTSFTNFIKRMYNSSPFEGVKVVDDYDHQYFISVLSLDKTKYPTVSTMNRVAQVKAQSQANTFFNGSVVSSDLIIKTTETKADNDKTKTITETVESIKENASGFVNSLEFLTNFEIEEGKRMLFIFFKEMEAIK
jgi:hypothetical protein